MRSRPPGLTPVRSLRARPRPRRIRLRPHPSSIPERRLPREPRLGAMRERQCPRRPGGERRRRGRTARTPRCSGPRSGPSVSGPRSSGRSSCAKPRWSRLPWSTVPRRVSGRLTWRRSYRMPTYQRSSRLRSPQITRRWWRLTRLWVCRWLGLIFPWGRPRGPSVPRCRRRPSGTDIHRQRPGSSWAAPTLPACTREATSGSTTDRHVTNDHRLSHSVPRRLTVSHDRTTARPQTLGDRRVISDRRVI